jgi:hypothetical protein
MATTKKVTKTTTETNKTATKAAKKPTAKQTASTNGQAAAAPVDYLYEIGTTAGEIWQTLDDGGPMSVAALVRGSSASRDTVMQAIGWLAREEKIALDGDRTRQISLR